MPPALREQGLRRAEITAPLGGLIAVFADDGLRRLDFADRAEAQNPLPREENGISRALRDELNRYFEGVAVDFRTPLAPIGTPFQQAVWRALRAIPHGETRCYAQVAAAIGRPTAVRAVAQANARNPISILVPCHRVIGADGSLTGYASGVEKKRFLLDLERGGAASVAKPTARSKPVGSGTATAGFDCDPGAEA